MQASFLIKDAICVDYLQKPQVHVKSMSILRNFRKPNQWSILETSSIHADITHKFPWSSEDKISLAQSDGRIDPVRLCDGRKARFSPLYCIAKRIYIRLHKSESLPLRRAAGVHVVSSTETALSSRYCSISFTCDLSVP